MSEEHEARETLPRALRAALTGAPPRSIAELSRELGVSEKLLPEALEKLSRTLERQGVRLCMEAPRCVACGFVLEPRARAKRPSRCPSCRSERLTRPRFWIE